MKRYSILFIVLGLISLSSASSRAQSREIGGQSLMLDDGHGHVVDITTPVMTGPGPYSWVLPITAGGTALTLPSGTTPNSTLFWSGTQWLENATLLAGTGTYAGLITVPQSVGTPITLGLYGANSGGSTGGAVAIQAGQAGGATFTGGSITIEGGGGYGSGSAGTSPGGSVEILGGPGNNGNSTGGTATLQGGQASLAGIGAAAIVQGGSGGNTGTGGPVQIYGGSGGNSSGPGGNISFLTTPNNNGNYVQAMQITNTGSVQIGSSQQFTVDKNGHVITSNSGVTAAANSSPNFLSAISVSGSDESGVVSFTAGSSEVVQSILVSYGIPYGTAPVVIVTPSNLAAGNEWGYSVTQDNLAPYVTSSASGFIVTFYDFWSLPCTFNYIVIH